MAASHHRPGKVALSTLRKIARQSRKAQFPCFLVWGLRKSFDDQLFEGDIIKPLVKEGKRATCIQRVPSRPGIARIAREAPPNA